MNLGRIYEWIPCEREFTGGRVEIVTAPLLHLEPSLEGQQKLNGRFVEIANAGRLNERDGPSLRFVSVPIGNACPDSEGNFIFEPALGGGRFATRRSPLLRDRSRYIEASRFGEVNAYYHVTRIAEHIDTLLQQLGEKSLPKVRALVNAHVVTTQRIHWRRAVPDKDGTKWRPVSGRHYRFPKTLDADEGKDLKVAYQGEIQLGPGLSLTKEGWLPRIAGNTYRCNSSHIAGYVYQSYGYHITRHTADFQANALRSPYSQTNVKSQTESAISDYWAASLLDTPHIWCWHCRHDPEFIHPSSLASNMTVFEFKTAMHGNRPHDCARLSGALWDLRQHLATEGDDTCDLLVLAALLNVGRLIHHPYRPKIKETRRLRDGFPVFAACLMHADLERFGGKYSATVPEVMERWGINVCGETLERLAQPQSPRLPITMASSAECRESVENVRNRAADSIIPGDDELMLPDQLQTRLRGIRNEPYDLVAVGDVMTGGRMRRRLKNYGSDYPFAWVKPVFERSAIVLANLEGPFARHAKKETTTRQYAYRVSPASAHVIRRAGINVMTLANNHLLDCGRDGVRETLQTLSRQGIEAIGGGLDESTAHNPAIFAAGPCRIGLLGYYWNRRTSARDALPGSARDLPDLVERDVARLKPCVDRVVITVHWGVPYERQPSAEDRLKARHFIDCGADIVIGHHPHILQPVEIYRGRPIFYSVGNFAFGTGNSRAESILLAVRFLEESIEVDVFPAYVRNRDPRLDYQPKLMCGDAAAQTLRRLVSISGESGQHLLLDEFYGRLRVDSRD